MPTLAQRPCSKPGCQVLSVNRYCGNHQNQALEVRRVYDQQRNATDEVRQFRGSGLWKYTSRKFISLHPICHDCSGLATVSHHAIKARLFLAQLINASESERLRAYCDESNLMALCKSCHDARTAKGE